MKKILGLLLFLGCFTSYPISAQPMHTQPIQKTFTGLLSSSNLEKHYTSCKNIFSTISKKILLFIAANPASSIVIGIIVAIIALANFMVYGDALIHMHLIEAWNIFAKPEAENDAFANFINAMENIIFDPWSYASDKRFNNRYSWADETDYNDLEKMALYCSFLFRPIAALTSTNDNETRIERFMETLLIQCGIILVALAALCVAMGVDTICAYTIHKNDPEVKRHNLLIALCSLADKIILTLIRKKAH